MGPLPCNCRMPNFCNAQGVHTCTCTPPPTPFKPNDRVYSPLFGWGYISSFGDKDIGFYVRHEHGETYFYKNGKYYANGEVVLFHEKPITFVPAKPKEKIKKWMWAYTNILRETVVNGPFGEEFGSSIEAVKLPWTEKEFDA